MGALKQGKAGAYSVMTGTGSAALDTEAVADTLGGSSYAS